ncbi:MAG: hypothetical protein JNL32_13700 [Candidatus Kapabacteria bacterium]|nr:hypothetical protein [Candidatus Kapabacteria bacterium]
MINSVNSTPSTTPVQANNGNSSASNNNASQIFVPIKPPQDKLELSQAAVALSNSPAATNSESVQQKLESGFYDNPAVLRSVARKLNDSFSQGLGNNAPALN